MANVKNYVLLETITVGAAGASSVTFNNIPQTGYTDLLVKLSVRTNRSNGDPTDAIKVQFNSSSSGYTNIILYGQGTSVGSNTGVSTAIFGYGAPTSYATSNVFGNIEIYVPNYTSSNYKSVSFDGVGENNASASDTNIAAGLWSNTAAITSLSVSPNGGTQFVQYSTFYLYGLAAVGTTPTVAPYAAGGDIIQTDGTYWYHAFLSSGTFTPAKTLSADILCIAGGGGGGRSYGGGGGAGGLVALTAQSLSTTGYTVTIGAGAAAQSSSSFAGNNGSNSQFGALTAAVGGGGGGYYDGGGGSNGKSGGSGGGASGGSYLSGGTATSGQGYRGGNRTSGNGGTGGGGAGGTGQDLTSGGNGTGGVGSSTYSSWGSVTGTGQNVSGTYYFAGGGGGQSGAGGYGGGGTNTDGQPSTVANGTANTGGGGGGDTTQSAGGSGIIIVRYAI